MTTSDPQPRRTPLSEDRIVETAAGLADQEGLGALTMRRLGAELGVEAMSLYKHVADKDQILDGLVERVFGEIQVPSVGTDWKDAMRLRAMSAREVLSAHPWAIGLLETRGATGPSAKRYLDGILGVLRSAGFSTRNAAHAFWLLDSYVYGHVLQEISFAAAADVREAAQPPTASEAYPHLAELERHATRSSFTVEDEFGFGLELVLEALAGLRGRTKDRNRRA